ncbi:MAG: hypothetical protein MUE54_08570 [Anaerolineae bacterium]|nr:hypothetical protein [Anaerolineae bacterium]
MILQIEVTEEELQYLKQKAKDNGFSTVEEYIKWVLLAPFYADKNDNTSNSQTNV